MSEPDAPQTGGQRLAAWRKEAKKTQTECAAAVGARQATWSEWEADAKQPQIKYAIRIERLTGGAVPVTCWEPGEDTELVANDDKESANAAPTFLDPPASTGTDGVR